MNNNTSYQLPSTGEIGIHFFVVYPDGSTDYITNSQDLVNLSIDKGDGVFIEYRDVSYVNFTPVGQKVIIKSNSDIQNFKLIEPFDKKDSE